MLRRIENSGDSVSKDPSQWERRRATNPAETPPAPTDDLPNETAVYPPPPLQSSQKASALRATVQAHRRAKEVSSASRREEFVAERVSALRTSSAPSGALASEASLRSSVGHRPVLSPVAASSLSRESDIFPELGDGLARPWSAKSRLMTTAVNS